MSKAKTAGILIKGLFSPEDWKSPVPAFNLKYDLEKYFGSKAYPINSGRSAIYSILKALNIGEGDEVIIQAYTCNAVPNPILWTGATPIYADIDIDTLNVDTKSVEKRISSKTKAIIIQHTFGRPGPIEEILDIAKKNKLIVIEDCAHSLGAKYKGKKLGTFGDAAILSFGREKVISSLAGGAVLVNNKNLEKPIEGFINNLDFPSFTTFLKEFNNFFSWRLLIRRVIFTGFGDKLLGFLNRKDFFNVVTSNKELIGERPNWYPKQFPGTLAKIAAIELQKVDKVNEERSKIAQYYNEHITNEEFKKLLPNDGIYLRYVLLSENANEIFDKAKIHKFWFGNWYNTPVYPNRVNLEKMKYKLGSCPNAEKVAKKTINLPIYQGMSENEAKEVVGFINHFK
ncbi:aminotransferase class I/II-fold pyridoxal phosphate-dependent enzyme [Patescibacteria group bacterium]|nr:aminotransferase class I/II-fold pyridoxal phosphate-dependent enzyme [Patescibacteria group bacterium]